MALHLTNWVWPGALLARCYLEEGGGVVIDQQKPCVNDAMLSLRRTIKTVTCDYTTPVACLLLVTHTHTHMQIYYKHKDYNVKDDYCVHQPS